jgi:hypothetical protein
MATVELKIRRMETAEVLVAEFPDLDSALAWLVERPRFVEVLRMVTAVEPEVEARMRASMRPLDEDERARQLELEAEAEARRVEERRRRMAEAQPDADDPDRPMVIRFERARGLFQADDADGREIPAVVREAVLAWIGERDSWVRERGEHVAAASLTVWPGAIPGGNEADRIIPGGQFVTGTRPPAGEA